MNPKLLVGWLVSALLGAICVHAGPENQTSPWGETVNGLSFRLTLPGAVEQGMSLRAVIELQADSAKLPAGVQTLNGFMHDDFLTLTLTEPNTGKQFDVKQFPFSGPGFSDRGWQLVKLDGRRIKPWFVSFPLVTLYSNLAPAEYLCRVKFSYPDKTPEWHREEAAAASDPATWWHGVVESGVVHLKVLPETPASQVFWIPTRLAVTKELRNIHSSDPPVELTAVPVIRFRRTDAQPEKLRVRNGHFLNTQIESRGGVKFDGGSALVPDDPNSVGAWYNYTGGDRSMDYRIQVFESAVPSGHLAMPGPWSPGFRLLWSNTYPVSLTEKEFQRLPVTVLDIPRGTSNNVCVALIRANPEVEELFAGNTGLRDADLALIGRLPHLRTLYLYENDITDAGLRQLEKLTRLTVVNLNQTMVTDSGVLRLRKLTRLENLALRKTSITDKGAAVVTQLPHLKLLDLAGTKITDATMARLPGLKDLEWLDLTGTEVTDKGLQNLTRLSHLKDLRLPAQATDECVEAINRALPDCLAGKFQETGL